MVFMLKRYVDPVIGAVSDMAIYEQIGFPGVPQCQPGARFRRVGLHVIAV